MTSFIDKNFVEFWCKKLMRFVQKINPQNCPEKNFFSKNELITPMIKSWPNGRRRNKSSGKLENSKLFKYWGKMYSYHSILWYFFMYIRGQLILREAMTNESENEWCLVDDNQISWTEKYNLFSLKNGPKLTTFTFVYRQPDWRKKSSGVTPVWLFVHLQRGKMS